MAKKLLTPDRNSQAGSPTLLPGAGDPASTGAVLSLNNESGAGGVIFNYDCSNVSTNSATFGVWIKTTQTTQQIVLQTLEAQPQIYIQNDQIGLVWAGTDGPWVSADTRPISDGDWHHIMVIFNNGVITLFKDGVSTSDSFVNHTTYQAYVPLNLGGNDGGNTPGFVGEIWNAQVWSVALDFDTCFYQVSNTYSTDFPTGLVFLSSFDAGSNTATNLINSEAATSMSDAQIITDALPEFASTPDSYTLTYSTKLSEDYIHSDTILASASAPQPLATFLNSSGQSEALVITQEGSATELCHLMREPLSNTGWNFVGIGASVQSIAAANSNSLAILSRDESIWVSNAGHWNPVSGYTGGSPAISALTDGTIFVTTDQGGQYALYQYDVASDNLDLLGAVPYAAPPVGWAGNLYTLDAQGEVLYNSSNPVNADSCEWQVLEMYDLNGDAPEAVFVTPDNSVYLFCASANNTYTAYVLDPDGVDWDQLDVPAGMYTIAPQSGSTFYALANNGGTTTLYSCDGNGNNTEVAQPAGRSLDAISVGAADGNLWGVDTFGTIWSQSNGSWVRMIQPAGLSGATGGDQLTEVVTGQHALGTQYAFYVMNGDLYYSSFEETPGIYGGYWTQPTSVGTSISNIGVVNDPVTASNLIVYGVNSTGHLVVVQDKNGTWSPTAYTMSESFTNVKPVFNTYNAYWLVYAIISGHMNASVGQLNLPQTQLTPLEGSPQLATMVPMSANPQGIDWPIGAMAIDTQGQLWMTQIVDAKGDMFAFQFVQLSGTAIGSAIGNVTRAVAIFGSEYDGIRVYATDDSDMLWILRLSNFDSTNNVFNWSEWHPLGNDCQILGTGCTLPPPNQQNLPPVDLFSLDANSQVNVLSEDATTGALTDLLMLQPAGTNEDASYVARYLTEVTIADNNGMPQPNFQLSVTSDTAVGIWVGQNTFVVSPSVPQTFNTDGTGKFTFSFLASDLHTPTFSFSAPNLNNPPSIYPAQEVQAYLAGSATALPAQPRFDPQGQTLSGAQMQIAPEWDSNPTTSFVTSQYTGNASTAAGIITQVAGTPPTSGPSGQWSVDGSTSGGLVGGSSFWHDLCSFPHDIDHAIKKAALTVSHLEVDAANAILKVTMALANDVTQVLDLAINTVEDIVSAIKTVFRYIGRAVDDAIHWLKSLFSWNDVLNTKNVLETLLNAMMSRLGENLNPNSPVYAGTIFDTYFQDLVTNVKNGFASAESAFSDTPSINDVAGSEPYPAQAAPMGPDALHPSSISNAQSAHSTHTSYVHNHAMTYANQGGTFPAADMGAGVLQALFDKIDANLNQDPYKTSQMEAITNLKGLTAKGFADVIIFDLINAIQDAVLLLLDVIQSVIDEVISLMGNALSTMQTLYNQPINIPVISWIYKKISDHTLTMLDLFCLTTALPATLLYKLTFGMPGLNPPFTSAQAQQIVTQYGDASNFPWPSIATPPSSGGVSDPRGQLGSFPFMVDAGLIPAFGFLYVLFDMANDATAYKNYKITPFPDALPPDPVDTFLSHCGCFTSLAWQMFTANYTVMQNGSKSPADAITMAYWAYGFVPMGINWVFAFGAPNKRISTFNRTYGVPVLCASGLVQLALGVATSVLQAVTETDPNKTYNAFYWAQNVIAPIPTVLKPLLTVQGDLAQEIASGVLIGMDLACDAASCALAFCQDL